jgi:hypothetical protein
MTRRSRPPTVSVWHIHLERAEFESLSWRDHTGRVRFTGQRPTPTKRFRERVSPVFWRIRRPRRTTGAWNDRARPPWAIAYDRSLDKAFRVALARRWLVSNPLARHWDRVDEAIEATRGTRA